MPNFFKKFPTIQYSLDGYSKDAMNILCSAILKRINVDKAYVYQNYDVPAGMSSMALAHELYKDSTLEWTFFLVNGMVNPLLDWPMDDSTLEEYVTLKYGSVNEIVYFTDLNTGFRLDDVAEAETRLFLAENSVIPASTHPVTAIEHENELNRQRGRIKIIAPRHINQFVDLFNKTIEGKI